MTALKHDVKMACLGWIKAALIAEADHRSEHDDWVERERMAVAVAANEWATAHGYDTMTTVADVERLEVMAVGHADYMTKLSLYVADRIVYGEDSPPR